MMRILTKLVGWSVFLIAFLLFNAISVLALNETPDKDYSYFISLKAPYISIGGDFDGESDLFREIGPVYYGLYEFEDNLGEGIVFGASNDLYTIEFSYSQSEHEISGMIPKSVAELDSFDITVKFFPKNSIDKRFRPYGQIGYGIAQFRVENGACDDYVLIGDTIYVNEFDDANYTGSGWHLGFGFLCKINKKLSIDTSISYHRITFDEIKMFGYKYEPPANDVLMANTVASIGINYFF